MTASAVDRLGWYETRDGRRACVDEITTRILYPVGGYIIDENGAEQRSRWFKSGRQQAISPLDYPDDPDLAEKIRTQFCDGMDGSDLIQYLPHHLLRCPFCARDALLKNDGHDDVQHIFDMFIVRCLGCGASSGGYKNTESEAVDAWNTRTA